MKKKVFTLLAMLLCAIFCLTGCGLGSFIEKGGRPGNGGGVDVPIDPDDPNKPTDPDDPDDPNNPVTPPVSSADYTVTVFFNNRPFSPGDNDIYVVWQNATSVKRVLLTADGTANAGELDGSYSVYLEGLPSAYTYNPNGNVATAESRKVTLLLISVRSPEKGDGGGLYGSQGCYSVRYDGTYRAVISRAGEYKYYEYSPTAPGTYTVESWVNVYENTVNPMLQLYNGTIAYKWPEGDKPLDDGGFSLAGGYTQNFKKSYSVRDSEVGQSFTFAVTGESSTGDYPLYIDFAITYTGEPEDPNGYDDVRTVRANEATTKAAERQPGETLTYADFGTRTFNADNFRYNDNTGFYHYYSATLYADDPYGYGENYGPILCCALNRNLPSYTITTLYNANATGLDGGTNMLKLSKQWIEEEQKFVTLDYTAFIREDYYRVCNSDKVCYVTEELKQFLQAFADTHSFWTDGVGPSDGTPEQLGYYAKQDALWLFACCVYL